MISESAKQLIDVAEKFMSESCKTDYICSIEEQRQLEYIVKTLNNHVTMLINYEDRRNKKD